MERTVFGAETQLGRERITAQDERKISRLKKPPLTTERRWEKKGSSATIHQKGRENTQETEGKDGGFYLSLMNQIN